MIKDWRRRRAMQRVKPGDGRTLKSFRWWQLPFRALFHLRFTHVDGRHTDYAVDVRHWQNQSSGNVKAQLYLNRRQHVESRLPAAFPVQGGTVEVSTSTFGLKRCHYVTAAGAEHQLTPDPDSAEGRRAHFDRTHPALSRGIGALSAIVLVTALALLIPQLAGQVTRLDMVSQHTGTFTAPVYLLSRTEVRRSVAPARSAERLWAGAVLGRVIMAPQASGESGSLWTCPLKHDVGAMISRLAPKWLPNWLFSIRLRGRPGLEQGA